MTGLMMRQSLFERALWRLDDEASAGHPYHTPKAIARRWMMANRAASDVPDEEIRTVLSDQAIKLLSHLADAHSRNLDDVAAKVAVVILEGANESGPIVDATQSILGHVLAELVLLGDKPLPSTGVLMGMTKAELELQEVPITDDD